jgi:hypothetical protein
LILTGGTGLAYFVSGQYAPHTPSIRESP